MSRQVLRALSLALVFALGVAVVPFAFAGSKDKRTASAAQNGTPLLKNISRSCGRSKSSKRIKTRTRKTLSSSTVRYTSRYCSGRVLVREVTVRKGRTVTKTITIVGRTQTVAGPTTTVTGPTQTVTGPTTTVPAPKPYRLTLLQNNDGESKARVGDSVPLYGGVTRFKTVLDRLRNEAAAFSDADIASGAKRKGTVAISSGDSTLPGLNLRASFEKFDADGSPFYDSIAYSRFNYDAASIGNHEYDFGPARFAQFVRGDSNDTPFLSVNANYANEPVLKALEDSGRLRKSTVVLKGGDRIGIIGVTPPDTTNISKPGNVTFATNIAELVNAEAAALTADGVDKIIFASHLQNSANERAVTAQLRNVDIVIAGGGDDLLAGPDDLLVPTNGEPRQLKPSAAVPNPAPPRPVPVGPYPTLIPDADGRQVPLVTTAGEYRYVGRLTAEFDAAGRITSIDDPLSGPVRVSAQSAGRPETQPSSSSPGFFAAPADPDAVAEDATLKREVDTPLGQFSAVLEANNVGTTAVVLDGNRDDPIRVKESNLGNLVADSFRYVTNKTAVAEGRPVAQIAFSNGGGIRRSIDAGPINEKETFDVLPFDNYMVSVPAVTRQKLKDLMEHGVISLRPDPASTATEQGNGRFPQISGFKITVDTRLPAQTFNSSTNAITTPGQRIRTITLDDGTPIVVDGAVVPGPDLTLATTNFTAGGGDNYPFLGLPFQAAGSGAFIPYQQSLFQFIKDPIMQGALGGTVPTDAASPYRAGVNDRITIIRNPPPTP